MIACLETKPAVGPAIVRWTELGAAAQQRLADIDAIFFEASGTRSFASEAERDAFRDRWLGRYLRDDPQFFYLLFDGEGRTAGYLAGAIEDPARSPRFADVGYFSGLAPLTKRFPAHLHINLAPQYRSRGWGQMLIRAFVADAVAAGAPGVHVVTGWGVRNVRFYLAAGFREVGQATWRDRKLVMLGLELARAS